MIMAMDTIPLNPSKSEEDVPSLSSDDRILLETTKVTEEDAAKFPGELVLELHQEPAPEVRQHLSQWVGKMTIPEKIRLAILGNQEARNLLIHDPNKVIPLAVLRNPKLGETEVILYAQMRTIPEDVFWEMAKHKTWIKNYFLKLALVSNPKTPLALAIKLLDYLHDRDLQNLSRSKNVSSVLARSAARLLYKRRG
jgi:hypothetical protein